MVSAAPTHTFNLTYPVERKCPERGNFGRPSKAARVRAGRRADLVEITRINMRGDLQVLAWIGDGERGGFGPGESPACTWTMEGLRLL